MKVFADTSVLVAASEVSHPHFPQARKVFEAVAMGTDKGFMSMHSIAELFASLTRLPIQPRVHPMEARRLIVDNICACFEVVALERDDYVKAVGLMSSITLVGAKIYDALILRCAAKCDAERIYTFNVADFSKLATPELVPRICVP